MPDTPISLKLYRFLLKLYPSGFRDDYAGPMERAFRDELAESNSRFALAKLWARLLADLAISIPIQFSREVSQDARHTLRLWRRRPWQTGFAILALAIGIGANTGVFSVVNALLLRSLPFHDPSRLVSFDQFFPPWASAKEFHEWRQQQSAYLADAAVMEQYESNLGRVDDSATVNVANTSWNFFSLLGVQPAIGRRFRDGEDTPGNNDVAVISYGLWQQLFGGDPQVLGSTVPFFGTPITIIGVAPPGFDFPNNTALWKPGYFTPGNNGWEAIARLKSGVTWPQARAAFAVESDRLAQQRGRKLNSARVPRMISLRDKLAGPVKNASLLLLAGVILILLIACTNIANLLMARTADRAPELFIRSALGATRARLAQQLLTECLLLSVVAAIAGLFVAFWTTSIASKVQPAPLSAQRYLILDWRVLCFTIAAAFLSSIIFGVLPSLFAGRIDAVAVRASRGTRGARLIREALVGAQVMLTLVLLSASISVGRAFVNLMNTDRGFVVKGLATVTVSLRDSPHALPEHALPYFQEALDRIRRLPGVRSASATEFLPLYAKMFMGGPWGLDGQMAKESSMRVPVLPDYFKTMGGRFLCGREFTEAEVRSNAKVVVVNERFASEFGRPEDALDHQVTQPGSPPWKIIGVVKPMDYMTDGANSNQIFIPAHSPGDFSTTFVVRADGSAERSLPMIRDTIRSVDSQVPIVNAKTMEQRLDDLLMRPRFYRTAVLFFAGFGLLLATIGIFGVVSYAVAQRIREMGVRLALGATPTMLRGTLLWQGLITVAVGAVTGIAGAILTERFLESLVIGARPIGPTAFVLSISCVTAIASASIWIATRRIARLDVMEILRTE
jgi:predicted permease